MGNRSHANILLCSASLCGVLAINLPGSRPTLPELALLRHDAHANAATAIRPVVRQMPAPYGRSVTGESSEPVGRGHAPQAAMPENGSHGTAEQRRPAAQLPPAQASASPPQSLQETSIAPVIARAPHRFDPTIERHGHPVIRVELPAPEERVDLAREHTRHEIAGPAFPVKATMKPDQPSRPVRQATTARATEPAPSARVLPTGSPGGAAQGALQSDMPAPPSSPAKLGAAAELDSQAIMARVQGPRFAATHRMSNSASCNARVAASEKIRAPVHSCTPPELTEEPSLLPKVRRRDPHAYVSQKADIEQIAPPSRVAFVDQLTKSASEQRMAVRLEGVTIGTVAFQVTPERAISVHLGHVLDLFEDRFDEVRFAQLRGAEEAAAYISLDRFADAGIPVRYDPVYDELVISTHAG